MIIFLNKDLPAKTNGKVQQGNSATFCDPKAATTIHQVHAMKKMNKFLKPIRLSYGVSEYILLMTETDFADKTDETYFDDDGKPKFGPDLLKTSQQLPVKY